METRGVIIRAIANGELLIGSRLFIFRYFHNHIELARSHSLTCGRPLFNLSVVRSVGSKSICFWNSVYWILDIRSHPLGTIQPHFRYPRPKESCCSRFTLPQWEHVRASGVGLFAFLSGQAQNRIHTSASKSGNCEVMGFTGGGGARG